MKRVCHICFLVLAWFCLAVTGGEATTPGRWDFGTAGDHENAEHCSWLLNKSTKVMRVSSVRASCACAVAEADFTPVMPGGYASAVCRIDLKGMEGTVQKNFWVRLEWVENTESNALANPEQMQPCEAEAVSLSGDEGEIVLRIEGTVRVRVRLTSSEVCFRSNESQTVRLVGYAKEAVITQITPPLDSCFKYQIAYDRRAFFVEPVKELPPGSWVEHWEISVNDPKVHSLKLRVRSLKQSQLAISPETLVVRNGLQKAQVLIRSLDRAQDFQILAAEVKGKETPLELTHLGRGRWRVILKADELVGLTSDDCLLLHTDIPGEETLVVPIVRTGEK